MSRSFATPTFQAQPKLDFYTPPNLSRQQAPLAQAPGVIDLGTGPEQQKLKEPPALDEDVQGTVCKVHLDRQVEYYCSDCQQPVCSKCMFKDHNGH